MKLTQKLVRMGVLGALPAVVKNPFRRLLRPESIYNEKLLRIGLDEILETDVFLCSYPKSGNTWMRFLLANMLNPNEDISFRNIDTMVPEIARSPVDLNQCRSRPIMKTHWPYLEIFPKTIYIYRDPRDALISYYHYAKKNNWFSADFSTFIRSEMANQYGDWGLHVNAALRMESQYPDRVLLIQYEEMLVQSTLQTARLARYIGLHLSAQQISVASALSSFENLQAMEQRTGGERSVEQQGFFRSGTAGGWKNTLSCGDVEWINEKFRQPMLELGYL